MAKIQEFWKEIALVFFTTTIMMLGFWLVEAHAYVPREEISDMIQLESPYTRDQNMITNQLSDLNHSTEELTKVIGELNAELSYLRGLREREDN